VVVRDADDPLGQRHSALDPWEMGQDSGEGVKGVRNERDIPTEWEALEIVRIDRNWWEIFGRIERHGEKVDATARRRRLVGFECVEQFGSFCAVVVKAVPLRGPPVRDNVHKTIIHLLKALPDPPSIQTPLESPVVELEIVEPGARVLERCRRDYLSENFEKIINIFEQALSDGALAKISEEEAGHGNIYLNYVYDGRASVRRSKRHN
jgi:hypothetical protein